MRRKNLLVWPSTILVVALLTSCAGMTGISDDTQKELVSKARISLEELYASTPEARELRARSSAILVFPDIFRAGLLAGGSGGNGVLLSPDGEVLGYYNAASASYGLQVGAQSYSETMFLTTKEALEYIDSSSGWSIGAGPTVVVMNAGLAKDLSSTTLQSDIYAFIYNQGGLMGGLALQGQKITKLHALLP